MDDRELLLQYWVAHRTVQKMCADRGFPSCEAGVRTPDEFLPLYLQQCAVSVDECPYLPCLRLHAERPDGAVLDAYFFRPETANKEYVVDFLDTCRERAHTHVIVVLPAELTHAAREVLLGAEQTEIEFELFLLSEVQMDWTASVCQSHIVLLTEAEARAHFERYALQPAQLSGLLMDDPVCRWFNLKRGQVLYFSPRDNTARKDFFVVGNEK